MKRVRLSTLMLLVVIAALCVALGMERNRASRLEQRLPKFQVIKLPSAKLRGKVRGVERPSAVEPKEVSEGDKQ
jgi:hypothetical protein